MGIAIEHVKVSYMRTATLIFSTTATRFHRYPQNERSQREVDLSSDSYRDRIDLFAGLTLEEGEWESRKDRRHRDHFSGYTFHLPRLLDRSEFEAWTTTIEIATTSR